MRNCKYVPSIQVVGNDLKKIFLKLKKIHIILCVCVRAPARWAAGLVGSGARAKLPNFSDAPSSGLD